MSKILFEAHILKLVFGGEDGLEKVAGCDPVELSRELSSRIQNVIKQAPASDFGTPTLSSLCYVAPTIGVPVLLEGNVLLRGPNITVPEPVGRDTTFVLSSQQDVHRHAQSGWVDLRSSNLRAWKER
jgi:hypothetical protein